MEQRILQALRSADAKRGLERNLLADQLDIDISTLQVKYLTPMAKHHLIVTQYRNGMIYVFTYAQWEKL